MSLLETTSYEIKCRINEVDLNNKEKKEVWESYNSIEESYSSKRQENSTMCPSVF